VLRARHGVAEREKRDRKGQRTRLENQTKERKRMKDSAASLQLARPQSLSRRALEHAISRRFPPARHRKPPVTLAKAKEGIQSTRICLPEAREHTSTPTVGDIRMILCRCRLDPEPAVLSRRSEMQPGRNAILEDIGRRILPCFECSRGSPLTRQPCQHVS
jgi:hypothetical protein